MRAILSSVSYPLSRLSRGHRLSPGSLSALSHRLSRQVHDRSSLLPPLADWPVLPEKPSSAAKVKEGYGWRDAHLDAVAEKICWQTEDEDKLYKLVELEFKGHDHAVLRSYDWFLREAARNLGIEVSRCYEPLAHFRLQTTLKSVFVYKKHQVQYHFPTYTRVVQLRHLTGTTASVYLEYAERMLPEGVGMEVMKLEVCRMPEHLNPPAQDGTAAPV